MGDRERQLVWVLRLSGSVVVLAFLASLLPESWMRVAHEELLGMGHFPTEPLVEYLIRSVALLYGFHGVLVWIASMDVRRYRPIVQFCGTMNIVFGTCMVVIDWKAGMPWFWVLGEGPPIAAIGVVILWLLRAVPRR